MAEEGLRSERPAPNRAGSGLAVADLLSGPSPSTPQRRPSNEDSEANDINAKEDDSTPPIKQPKVAAGACTPNKRASVSNTQPITPEAVNEGLTYQYPPVQQVLEGRENIEYILRIREQPKHSRMCGVGEKADRRPIDPAPIIQLRVVIHPHPVSQASEPDPKASPQAAQKKEAASTASCNPKSDPALPHLRRGEPVTTEFGQGWEDKAWYLENPYYFMCAMLADAEKDEELHLLSDGKTRYTTGSCVSCLYHLRDIDGSHQGFFVFPDLSIRVEGRYRLKLCLFETIGNQVHHCKSIFSDPFMVYTAKRFPGMEESTRLSRSFADQGLKVRVRKNTRGRKGRGARPRPDHEDGSEGEDMAQRGHVNSSQKRLRSDSWLSTGSASDYSAGPGQGLPVMSTNMHDPRQLHRPTSPISPRLGWSGPASSGSNYIAHRSIEPLHFQAQPHGGPLRPGEDASRGRSLSLVEERAMRSRGHHQLPQFAPSRDYGWTPPQRPPYPAATAPGSPAERPPPHPSLPPSWQHHSPHLPPPPPFPHNVGSPPHPPHYVTGPPPIHGHLDPRSRPASPEFGWDGMYGQPGGAARQRSFSSAATLAPRPWERPSTHSMLATQRSASNAGGSHTSSVQHSPASTSAASSRPRSPSGGGFNGPPHFRSSLAYNPPRPGSHSRLSSHLATGPVSHHSRERSLSDPRRAIRPPPTAWESSLPPLPSTRPLPVSSRALFHHGETGAPVNLPPLEEQPRRTETGRFPPADVGRPTIVHNDARSYERSREESLAASTRRRHTASIADQQRAMGWHVPQPERR